MNWLEIIGTVALLVTSGFFSGFCTYKIIDSSKKKELLLDSPMPEVVKALGTAILNPDHNLKEHPNQLCIRKASSTERQQGLPAQIKEYSVFLYEISPLGISFFMEPGFRAPFGGIEHPTKYYFNRAEQLFIQNKLNERTTNLILTKSV